MLWALLLYGLGSFCVLVTIVPFHKDETWWVRVCDFPRTQVAVLIAATLAGILALTEKSALAWTMSFALLVCLGVQLAVILPSRACGRSRCAGLRTPRGRAPSAS